MAKDSKTLTGMHRTRESAEEQAEMLKGHGHRVKITKGWGKDNLFPHRVHDYGAGHDMAHHGEGKKHGH